MVLGMTMRAVAIIRPMSQMVGASLLPSGVPEIDTGGMEQPHNTHAHIGETDRGERRSKRQRRWPRLCRPGLPLEYQRPVWCYGRRGRLQPLDSSPRALIGTDSGCSGSVDSVCSRPMRSCHVTTMRTTHAQRRLGAPSPMIQSASSAWQVARHLGCARLLLLLTWQHAPAATRRARGCRPSRPRCPLSSRWRSSRDGRRTSAS